MTHNGNAIELQSFAVNEASIMARLEMSFRNLERKMKRQIYDREKAVKLFKMAADDAAKAYSATYGGTFSVQDRLDCATLIRDDFEIEICAGNSWL